MPAFTTDEIKAGQVFLIDKPLTWTSFAVVNKLRYALKKTYGFKKLKVGHAGTLDPLATGLLIICAGNATKSINQYMGQHKIYTGQLKLGATTPSYDLETEEDNIYPTDHITPELLEEKLRQFQGDIQQIPPVFSAIKKDGVKSYEAARLGIDIEMEARPVHIHYFKITAVKMPFVNFEVKCSKGTYIRSLAHDFGQALNSGSHLTALRRIAIGDFSVENASGPLEFTDSLQIKA
ncbi:MAG: tRNA pseudouridine(55) synthase TruB [Micavibrio sp.]|nr:tRNA pseudouridine(55) synthase TruB [Micavibrio sp.]